MKKTPVKEQHKKEYISKTPSVQQQVEINREIISEKLSGSNIKRLNNLNWLRHEISWQEPRILFYKPINQQKPFFDYSCTKGIEAAYDYIIDPNNTDINKTTICDLHYLIAKETNLQSVAGLFRQNSAVLEINVNGFRMHTPDPYRIPSLLENALYDWKNSSKPTPLRAFDLHYNLIAIHLFEDYNKRTARMVMNWALVQNNYRPIVFNRKSDKENYRKALSNMANGNSKEYYKYMFGAMVNTQKQLINQLNTSIIR